MRFFTTFLGFMVVFCFTSLATAVDAPRPNILFIIADDQSAFDFKIYDTHSILETPTITSLANDGMVLDAAYHMGSYTGAVCTASRHMIMTGRSVWHLPDGPGATSHCPPDIAQQTMAAVFNRAGYKTMRTCKSGNSYPDANAQFTVVHDATKRGSSDSTGSAWHADQVLNYLNNRVATSETAPFLIYFGFSHPHDTRNGKTELLNKYGAVNHTDSTTLPPANINQPPLMMNYLDGHPFDNGHLNVRDEVNVSGVWTNRDPVTMKNELGRQFACSENIDIQINRVLQKLDDMGELDNTYIFYTSDHGIAIGRHGLQGKQNLYEHTWQVPFIVKGPGIKPGTRAPGNIYLMDVLATMCDLAGIDIPATNEGISFKPVLFGEKPVVRLDLYGAYSGGDKPGMRSVRLGDWKLIKYDADGGNVHKTQLFNLKDNPYELLAEHHADAIINVIGNTPNPNQKNLAGDPAYAEKLAEMEALLLSEMRRYDDPYRLWNQPSGGGSPNSYAVTYAANGGTGSMDSQNKIESIPLLLATNSFVRTGFTFSGWNSAADGTGVGYADVYAIDAPITLFAQWSVSTTNSTSDSSSCGFGGGIVGLLLLGAFCMLEIRRRQLSK